MRDSQLLERPPVPTREGKCTKCGEFREFAPKRGRRCRDCEAEVAAARYAANRERYRKVKDATRKADSERVRQRRREYYARLRVEVIQAYGGRCTCCGETEIRFLCIDHVNDDGNVHRAELGTMNIYSWLRHNEWPEGFQVLCANCNMAKKTGPCPHRGGESDPR